MYECFFLICFFTIFLLCLPLFFLYFVCCLILPVFKFGKTRRGGPIRCFLHKDSIHSDYIFESSLWSDIFCPKGRFIQIGWGDRKIFLETKTWRDLKIKDFLCAFFGMNDSVLKVDFFDEITDGTSFLDMECDQLEQIKKYILDSTNGIAIKKLPGYYEQGDFYESELQYNCVTNCNNWVGQGLRKAGLYGGFWFPLTIWIQGEKK